ncbi:MAG: hypothetical protein ABW212_17430 [Pseudonocardia sediminis]
MADSNTQFNQARIEGVAKQHDTMASEVQSQLKALQGQIQATMAGADSEMTQALTHVYEQWSGNVQKAVLDNVGVMAAAMRAEANNQEAADSDNTRQIMSTVSPVGSFLGG